MRGITKDVFLVWNVERVGRKVLCEKHARSYERMGRGEEERDRRAQKRQTIVTRR
jgi:hypothetical protein